jgi:hypothetical protein
MQQMANSEWRMGDDVVIAALATVAASPCHSTGRAWHHPIRNLQFAIR